MGSVNHMTVPVQVWVDVDVGIADCVRYLNTIPGVRTTHSCQGTIGEGGPAPYRAEVGVTWDDDAAWERLCQEFDVEVMGDHWGEVYPREGWQVAMPPQDDVLAEWQSAVEQRNWRIAALEQENAAMCEVVAAVADGWSNGLGTRVGETPADGLALKARARALLAAHMSTSPAIDATAKDHAPPEGGSLGLTWEQAMEADRILGEAAQGTRITLLSPDSSAGDKEEA